MSIGLKHPPMVKKDGPLIGNELLKFRPLYSVSAILDGSWIDPNAKNTQNLQPESCWFDPNYLDKTGRFGLIQMPCNASKNLGKATETLGSSLLGSRRFVDLWKPFVDPWFTVVILLYLIYPSRVLNEV